MSSGMHNGWAVGVNPSGRAYWWPCLQVSYREATGQESSSSVTCLQSRHVCYSNLDNCWQKAEEIGSWECPSTGWPRKCFTIVLVLVQHLTLQALEGCGSESSQSTHHCASKSSSPQGSVEPAQHIRMLSAFSMCQLWGPNVPSSLETIATSYPGLGFTPMISFCNDPISK